MVRTQARQRVVIVGETGSAGRLAGLFSDPTLQSWDPLVADSAEHARFCSQTQTCGILLADQSVLESANDRVLGWLGARDAAPVVFLSDCDPELLQHALAQNVQLWLPRHLVLERPPVLAEGLRNVQNRHPIPAGPAPRGKESNDCQARLERLANLLWNALPIGGPAGLLTQRCLLERLHEEAVRAGRHNTPLTLILAELATESGGGEEKVNAWIAEHILRGKRRSDVAGQYGTSGIMLLLPHTSASGAHEVCRRLRHDLEQAPWRMHAAFGVASYSSQHSSPKSLLRLAEEGLDTAREME